MGEGRKFHHIKIWSDPFDAPPLGKYYHASIDGEEIRYLRSMSFDVDYKGMATFRFEIIAQIEMDAEILQV